jgi:hypothetical protein
VIEKALFPNRNPGEAQTEFERMLQTAFPRRNHNHDTFLWDRYFTFNKAFVDKAKERFGDTFSDFGSKLINGVTSVTSSRTLNAIQLNP